MLPLRSQVLHVELPKKRTRNIMKRSLSTQGFGHGVPCPYIFLATAGGFGHGVPCPYNYHIIREKKAAARRAGGRGRAADGSGQSVD